MPTKVGIFLEVAGDPARNGAAPSDDTRLRGYDGVILTETDKL